ncbi:hypothetical protein DDD63_00915 [Actinobaculum sp. 313]|nr:hypothetical protein DDD63_00915 [Actinobaculum sp. 313]
MDRGLRARANVAEWGPYVVGKWVVRGPSGLLARRGPYDADKRVYGLDGEMRVVGTFKRVWLVVAPCCTSTPMAGTVMTLPLYGRPEGG